MIKYLEWDSHLFKVKIGRVAIDDSTCLNNVFAEMKAKTYQCVYVLSTKKIDDEMLSSSLIDEKIVYSKAINNYEADSSRCKEYDGELTQDLLDLAYLSGHESRFKKDEMFSPFFKELYKQWLVNSLNKTFADVVIIANEGRKVLGFVTAKYAGEKAEVGLIAVGKENQGSGIGSELLIALENYLYKKGVVMLEIATQRSNKQACSFYEARGYNQKDLTYIYHVKNDTI